MLLEMESARLVCNNKIFGFNYECKDYFHANSFWKNFIDEKLNIWTIEVKTTSLSAPRRIMFSATFSRKNSNEQIVDYGVISYISVILVFQLLILPNREERIFIGLISLFMLLFELDSLEKLVVIRDNPDIRIMHYQKSLIIIQLVVLVESLIAYQIIQLRQRVPVPDFISQCFQFTAEKGFFIRLPLANMVVLNKIMNGLHQKRRTIDDYILPNTVDDDLVINSECSSAAGFSTNSNKKINMLFYDSDPVDCKEINEAESAISGGFSKLNWFYIAIALDRLVLVCVIFSIVAFTLYYK